MKKLHILVAIVATLSAFVANGQFKVDYTPANGQGKILLTSKISGMKDTSRGIRIIEVSNNTSFIPVIAGKNDSVFSSGSMSFKDTFKVSVPNPMIFYVRENVTAKDTSGQLDTAKSIAFLPVFVTPKFKDPAMQIFKPIVSQTTATVSASFNSGYDSGYANMIISFGDSLFQNPSINYSIKKATYPVVGTNQNINLTFNLNLGVPGYLFSYRIHHYTSMGDTLSPIFWGKTLDQPAPAMVSSPYNAQSYSDSVVFYDETIASGLQTKHTAYIAKSPTAKPFDSVFVNFAAGQPDGIIRRNSFKNLMPENDYYVWSAVKNSLNILPSVSNRVLIQTGKRQIAVFKLSIDSTASVNTNTQAIYISAQIPIGKSAQVVILGRRSPNGQTVVLGNITLYPENPYATVLYNGCIESQSYDVTAYGSDANHTRDYDAWEVMTTFKFKPNYTASVVKVQKEKIVVYPNPAKDVIHASEPIILFNSLGDKVRDGKDFFIDDLPRGLYFYYSTLNQNIISGKVMLE